MKFSPSDDWVRDWPRAEPYIADAIARDAFGTRLQDVQAALRKGAQLWVGTRSAAVVQIEEPLIQLWLAGGEMAEILEMLTALEQWASTRNFSRVMIYGRKGWERAMQHRGFSHKWTVLEKQIWQQPYQQ